MTEDQIVPEPEPEPEPEPLDLTDVEPDPVALAHDGHRDND